MNEKHAPRGRKVSRPQSLGTIELEAEYVADRMLGRRRDPFERVSVARMLEELLWRPGGLVVQCASNRSIGVGAAVCELPNDLLARTRHDRDEGLVMMEFIDEMYELIARDHPAGRHAFAHELGHASLHAEDLLDRIAFEHESRELALHGPRHGLEHDSEWQAESFAFAFLAPLSLLQQLRIRGILTTDHVAAMTGLSKEHAAHRILMLRRAGVL